MSEQFIPRVWMPEAASGSLRPAVELLQSILGKVVRVIWKREHMSISHTHTYTHEQKRMEC